MIVVVVVFYFNGQQLLHFKQLTAFVVFYVRDTAYHTINQGKKYVLRVLIESLAEAAKCPLKIQVLRVISKQTPRLLDFYCLFAMGFPFLPRIYLSQ